MDHTTVFAPTSPYLQKYWLICESFLAILTVLTAYLTFCLVKYALKKPDKREGKVVWQKKALKLLSVFSSFSLLLRLISDHVVAFWGWQNDDACFTTVTISTIMLMLSLYSVYAFLWVRQSIFYTNPIMKKLIRPELRYLSWFVLAFMLMTGVVMGVLYNLSDITKWVYAATEVGCIDVSKDSNETITYVVASCTIFFQFTLLGLFIYPLHSKRMDEFRSNGEDTPNNSDKYHTSTLSRSEEGKPGASGIQYVNEEPGPSKAPKSPKKTNPVISPLAMQPQSRRFTFEKTNQVSLETDNESGADSGQNEPSKPWPKTTTIKRERPHSPTPSESNHRKKSIFQTSKLFKGTIYFKAKTHSASSENASPVVSDSEQSQRSGGTLTKFKRKFTRKSVRNDNYRKREERKKGGKMLELMKKCTYLMLTCIFTDIIAAVIQIAFDVPELIYLVIYDVSLLINVLCIVVTFKDWRTILLPCPEETEDDSHQRFPTGRLKRSPTPLRSKRKKSRVHELRSEGKGGSKPSSRRSSGSGYESGESSTHGGHIYRPPVETRELLNSKRATSAL